MRPRLITAENGRDPDRNPAGAGASMRPRLITAENVDHPGRNREDEPASMRPRLITAENATTSPKPPTASWLQ